MNSLTTYLQKFYRFQDKIMLVYHPTKEENWTDRVFYLGEGYNASKQYNHRNILDKEVVIEYDFDSREENKKYADEVYNRLVKDNLQCSKWFSGNKSYHVHCFINTNNCTNLGLLKKVFIRHYCKDLPIPDLQLSGVHLIRAEFGVHESTGKKKILLVQTKNYPVLNEVPVQVWNKYISEQTRVINTKTTNDLKNFDTLPGIKLLLTTEEFKKARDGRSRSLLLLIYALKGKYTKEELVKYLQDWYRYTSGTKMTPLKIQQMVYYYWEKNYSHKFYVTYLHDLLEEIGRTDLIKE